MADTTQTPAKNPDAAKEAAKANDEATKTANQPASNDTAGTSNQPHNPKQETNQQLNPAIENAAGNAAAPGHVPSNKVNQPPASTSDAPELSAAENQPKPNTAVASDGAQWRTVTRGKHRYNDPETGEAVVAKAGERAYVTQSQYDRMRDRFQ